MKKEVTIYDIARKLEISASTVSRALNNQEGINAKTAQKIKKTAQKMGYRPNAFAANIRNKKTNTIGVLVPRLNSHFISTAISGIEKIISEAGYRLLISQSNEDYKREAANANSLYESRIDGLIVSLAAVTTKFSHFSQFLKKGIPVVFFDRICCELNTHRIIIDNQKSAYIAVKHLIETGCKNIVHITGNQQSCIYKERKQGYIKALEENGLRYSSENIIPASLTIENGISLAKDIIRLNADGVFCSNDASAIGCISGLKKAGIKIPEQIAVAGFNNEPSSLIIEPNLTTIHYPAREMGETAALHLIRQITNNNDLIDSETVTMKTKLIVRDSTRVSKNRY